MKVLSVVGPDADPAARRIVSRLAREGSTVRIERAEPTADGGSLDARGVADAAIRLAEDGWSATGVELDLDRALDRLAAPHDYAVVTGFPDAALSRIAVGEASEGVLLTAPSSEELDLDALVEALDDVEPLETLESLVARVKESPSADRSGAIATFTGRVRERDDDDDARTTHLEFEKYEGVADERMAAIAADLKARDGVYEVALHHRTGVVEAGEDIVFVVVLAGHRREAFEAVEDGIDRLKDEVPLFKKEVTVEDEFWVGD